MKKIIIITGLALLTWILAACSPLPLAIFQDDICAPPCWRGIIPGQTTLQEAKASLQTFEDVEPTSIEPRTILNANDSINFQFHSSFREYGGAIFSQGKFIVGISF